KVWHTWGDHVTLRRELIDHKLLTRKTGGSGGSSASCTVNGRFTSVSGGTTGPAGSNGANGARGANGASGAPGRVEVRIDSAP
ncbi:MAG TPA: DUF2087 domain-containing protein, partial [Polyangiaceae bacterium]|nr:DUF2087 domain-containing protein [Polyangiaceae bacterium]